MAKLQIPILFLVMMVAFASTIHRTIGPSSRRFSFKKFEKGEGVIGVVGQEMKTSTEIQCSRRYGVLYVINI